MCAAVFSLAVASGTVAAQSLCPAFHARGPSRALHIENDAGQLYLVGINDGLRHEAIRDIVLSTRDGRELKPASGISPYILAGTTRRWAIAASSPLPPSVETLSLQARADAGAIEQQVPVVAIR
ncbi:MAG TPA: hypothetical protein VHX13_08880 [Acidobacteriaceae bacterium]|nr:hypothetical protein [Acidobacteriaceae bacterium]